MATLRSRPGRGGERPVKNGGESGHGREGPTVQVAASAAIFELKDSVGGALANEPERPGGLGESPDAWLMVERMATSARFEAEIEAGGLEKGYVLRRHP